MSKLPNPVIELEGTEDYQASGTYTRYSISVTNHADYPNDLFAASPDLPACGSNTNSARTWVDIYNGNDDSYIYGFCALGSSSDLTDLWFAVSQGTSPPSKIYLVMNDRLENKKYKSNILDLAPHPNPKITLTGTQQSTGASGPFTEYNISVTNYADYPNDLFSPSPSLPACGSNTNSARTWVDIYNGSNDDYIYGFCALTSSSGLTTLWFGVDQGQTPPSSIYLVMDDRLNKIKYKSNTLSLS